VFLYRNKKWLSVDTKVFYNFAVWIAQSPADAKNAVIQAIEEFIKKYMINYIH
jgi:hypothetical protein